MAEFATRWVGVLMIAGAALGGCAQQAEKPAQAATSVTDDDAYCQAKGLQPGTDGYVNCRRDRDYVASLRNDQSKYNLRKMQDYMMDNK